MLINNMFIIQNKYTEIDNIVNKIFPKPAFLVVSGLKTVLIYFSYVQLTTPFYHRYTTVLPTS